VSICNMILQKSALKKGKELAGHNVSQKCLVRYGAVNEPNIFESYSRGRNARDAVMANSRYVREVLLRESRHRIN
jgi:hypothetical protein